MFEIEMREVNRDDRLVTFQVVPNGQFKLSAVRFFGNFGDSKVVALWAGSDSLLVAVAENPPVVAVSGCELDCPLLQRGQGVTIKILEDAEQISPLRVFAVGKLSS